MGRIPWQAWGEFFRPVHDSEIPDAKAYVRRGVRIATLALAGVSPIVAASLIASGAVHFGREIGLTSISFVVMLALYRASFTRVGRQTPEALAMCVGLVAVAVTLGGHWAALDSAQNTGSDALSALSFAAVVAFSGFTPWRARFAAGLGLGTGALHLLFDAVNALPNSVPAQLVVGVSLTTTMIGAAIAHHQRQIWASLHRATEQAVATSRLSSVGRLAEGLAHEARTPLASTLNDFAAARVLLDELGRSIGIAEVTDDDLAEIVTEAKACLESGSAGLDRMAGLIGSLRAHAHDVRERPATTFSVNDALREVAALHAGRTAPKVRVDPSAVASARGDPDTLRRVLNSLVLNAVQAIAESGSGSIVRIGVDEAESGVVLWVDDDGPGVPEGLEERMFEPMVTKRVGAAGLGLGLAIARDLVESAFFGHLVLTRARPGARIEVILPKVPRQARKLLGPAHRPELAFTPVEPTMATPPADVATPFGSEAA